MKKSTFPLNMLIYASVVVYPLFRFTSHVCSYILRLVLASLNGPLFRDDTCLISSKDFFYISNWQNDPVICTVF